MFALSQFLPHREQFMKSPGPFWGYIMFSRTTANTTSDRALSNRMFPEFFLELYFKLSHPKVSWGLQILG